MPQNEARRRQRLAWGLLLLSGVMVLAGLAAGSEGWSLTGLAQELAGPDAGAAFHGVAACDCLRPGAALCAGIRSGGFFAFCALAGGA